MRKNKRKLSQIAGGGARMQELGYKPIQIWVDRDDMTTLKQAAEDDGRPVTRFVLRAALYRAAQLNAAKPTKVK